MTRQNPFHNFQYVTMVTCPLKALHIAPTVPKVLISTPSSIEVGFSRVSRWSLSNHTQATVYLRIDHHNSLSSNYYKSSILSNLLNDSFFFIRLIVTLLPIFCTWTPPQKLFLEMCSNPQSLVIFTRSPTPYEVSLFPNLSTTPAVASPLILDINELQKVSVPAFSFRWVQEFLMQINWILSCL